LEYPASSSISRALPIRVVEKPWGRDMLPPPFAAPPGARIGEIWFEPPPEVPALLVKYIFTSEALSVQVHPSDVQTQADCLGRQGKEECWFVIDAGPDARLGIGFVGPVTMAEARAAAIDGSIMDLIAWHPVRAGDFFYIPANTVHAIGAGISLIEIQQNSDITYRLYDHGRDRPLHLDEGMKVMDGGPYPDRCFRHVPPRGETVLVDGPIFHAARIDGPLGDDLARQAAGRPLLVIPMTDGIALSGAGLAPGACGLSRDVSDLTVAAGAQALIAWKL
jgi:mannose-6-phosphate isomerase